MTSTESPPAEAVAEPSSFSRRLVLGLSYGVLRALAKLPLQWQLALGRQLGRLMRSRLGLRLRVARTNLAMCFPQLSELEREALLSRHVEALGMGLFDTVASWFSDDARLIGQYRLEGAEHLDAALARGKGVLLLGAHFTTQELGVRMLSFHYHIHGVYRRHPNPAQEEVVLNARLGRFADMIPSDDMRKALKYLRQGKVVWYPPDQDFGEYGMEHSAFVPFFGIDAATVTVPGRLARSTGAALVPFFFRREPDGKYLLRIMPPLDEVADDPVAVAREFNVLLEREIVEVPEQYLWVHQRFKTRPNPSELAPYS
ncbi:lysophospholipid acyltransferase family protein [Zhongshania aquimaris]|uniref:Lysophospholipid acyltransferase family protein n=1 Tax=Zhongshania aquimaris TaxID=2857107 RepID=A0ABS6VRC0_9GAMM|nr:lysophospholipid acyltransferase family protein [Zhongshania aquimaris]MBW2940821.1 lysophospholipid acyltransferase family protein [Zhongshania aquimaris]